MLDYDRRLNEAWEKVPEQYKKEMLEEMEHKAYNQDFQHYDDSCNVIEIVIDAIIDVIKTILKKVVGIYEKSRDSNKRNSC